MRTSLKSDAVRFIVAGALNAALTLLVYQALLYAMSHQLAYAFAWLTGIAFIMIFYPARVFPEGRTAPVDRLLLGATYLGVFLFGLALLQGLDHAGIAPRIGILIVMVATTAVNFLAARFLLRR
ncbi:GtrA-like protein [Aureimonas altamirensis DSM 21988]|uniref:GtrA/DPMS transmembrane domain-containing protein n=2 Tax=Aureimonas altamirensis TaxID=370622 RepID=A0A0P0YW11_9HYPH|nr:GtrA family protein [Aureimonas altamirensis]BAT25491.1 hypothetical protein [Aureimonas altamirensis]SHK02536.1 GtrA-like protein [Aureimonas altamirensis DSM 21988]